MMPKRAKRTEAAQEPAVMELDEDEPASLKRAAEEPSTSTAATQEAGSSSVPPADDEVKPAAKKSKKAKQPPRRSTGDQPYENGVLRCLVVENFMNHEHLKVELDPHINFIVGKNGSGKSAIVNALIAGFGHTARSTGRNTNSAKSLIKSGKSHATISIHIANGGEDPWRPEEFGETIVAERRIDQQGAGTYRLRDGADGPPRKSSKAEFEVMCNHLNIQANNPCALLTQEHAKKFLHQGNGEDRYKFFLQAANLESRKHDLSQTRANVDLLEANLNKAEAGMAEKQAYAKQAMEEYEGARKLKELQEKEDQLEPLLGWALIAEQERSLKDAEDEAEQVEGTADEARQKLEDADATGQEMEKEVQQLTQQSQSMATKIERMANQAQKLFAKADAERKALKKERKHFAELEEGLAEATENESRTQAEVEQGMAALEATKSSAEVEHLRQLRALDAEVAALDERLKEATAAVYPKRSEYEASVEEWRAATKLKDEKAEVMAAKEQELKATKKASFDRLVSLHPDMRVLVDAVEKSASKFKDGPPLGPIGAYLAIKPTHAALQPAVEQALGKPGLYNFIVWSHRDERALKDIVNRVKRPQGRGWPLSSVVSIVVRKQEARFARSDGGADASASGGGTERSGSARGRLGGASSSGAGSSGNGDSVSGLTKLIDALDITPPSTMSAKAAAVLEDQIHNFLLDECSAENRMVTTSFGEGELYIDQAAKNSDVYVADSDPQSRPRAFRRRGPSTAVELLPKLPPRLVTDQKAAIAAIEQDRAEVAAELRRLQRDHDDKDKARKRLLEEEKAVRKEAKAVEVALTKKQDELHRVQSTAASDAVYLEMDQARNEYRNAQQHRTRLDRELDAARARLEHREAEYQPMKDMLAGEQAKYDGEVARKEAIDKELNNKRQPLNRAGRAVASLRKQLTQAQNAQKEIGAKVDECKAYIARMSPMVEDQYGPRVHDPKGRTLQQLKKEQAQIFAAKKRAEQEQGGKSIEKLAELAKAAKAKVDSAAKDINNVREMGEKEKAAFTERAKFFRKEAKMKAINAAADFNRRLTRKGHAGSLHFDHHEETLALSVVRNSQDENSAKTMDARGLSGGERSFTTLSFEIAMWEFCATPFRVLDEFDVFMDDTYRKQAVALLMEICDEQPNRQFLFITPQDMHPFLQQREKQPNKSVPRITKMRDVR